MTDYTNFDTLLKKSHTIEGLDEIHSHILQLKEHIDEMEDSVLDASESFNLQQQSNVLWYKGDSMCDPETGDEITMDTYLKYEKAFHEQPTKKCCAEIENEKLKKEIEGHKKGLSKEELDETAKVICNLLDTSKKLKEENEKLKEDARTNLDYSLKYEKEGIKKDEEISQLKKENEKLKETLTKVDSLVSPVLFG